MKRKIFKYYSIFIFLILVLTGFFISLSMQNLYKNEVKRNLASLAFSIEYNLKNLNNSQNIDYYKIAQDFADYYNRENKERMNNSLIRVTFIRADGSVVGDSNADFHEMENHLNRKEIQEALKNSVGSDIRHSTTINSDLMYTAIYNKDLNIIIRLSVPLNIINKINLNILLIIFATIACAVLLSMFISYKISEHITKPLKDIILASHRISEGNFSDRIKTSGNDEIGQLSDNFNHMATALEKTISDLQEKNIEIESILDSITIGIIAVNCQNKIILINPTALKMFNIENTNNLVGSNILETIRNKAVSELIENTMHSGKSLEEDVNININTFYRISTCPIKPRFDNFDANDENNKTIQGVIVFIQDISKIRKLEQLRSEFVSNVTHELKTPITSIRGFVETLKSGSINDKKTEKRFLEIIDIEAERLHALINDILLLSEIESGNREANTDNLSLFQSVAETIEVVQHLAKEKKIQIINNVPKDITIKMSSHRLKQLLLNLIDNAIKYNNKNGIVEINACKEEGKIVITIKDNGIGISPEHLSRIFERFYRVDKSRSRELGGTGLGLSIVKHIVNLYNGDIKVKSEPKKGSEFIIQIPV